MILYNVLKIKFEIPEIYQFNTKFRSKKSVFCSLIKFLKLYQSHVFITQMYPKNFPVETARLKNV